MSTEIVGRDSGELQVTTNDRKVIKALRSFAPFVAGKGSTDEPRARFDSALGKFETWSCNRSAASAIRELS